MNDYQSLVLKADGIARLWLQDNGLRIQPRFSSEQRVPLCRLLRVQCYGDVSTIRDGFSTLLNIASRHIPVTFFDGQGHVCAQLYHPCPHTKPLALWAEHCFGELACQEEYRNWLDNQHYALLAQLHINQGSLGHRQELLQQQLTAWLKHHRQEIVFISLYQNSKRLLLCVLGEMLMAHGLAAGTTVRDRLFHDLQDLMEYWLQGHILQWLQHFGDITPQLLQAFHSHQSTAIGERLQCVLMQLQEMLEQYALDQVHH